MALTTRTNLRSADHFAAEDARRIPAHLPAADRARQMRFFARHGRDTRQDRADLESDLRFETWMRHGEEPATR